MLDLMTNLLRLQVIAQEGSLRRASEVLRLTQPALSRSLSQLEDHFGRPLLERHARGIRPTVFGDRLLTAVSRMDRYWGMAQEELSRDWPLTKQTIRIGAGPTWHSGTITKILLGLQKEFPNLSVELSMIRDRNVVHALEAGEFEVVFGGAFGDAGDVDNLVIHPLTSFTLNIVGRHGHPCLARLAAKTEAPEAILLDYHWVIYSEFHLLRDQSVYAVTERLGKSPNITVFCETLTGTIGMTQASDYLTILPDLVSDGQIGGGVQPLDVALNAPPTPLGMLYRRELQDWPPLRFLQDNAKTLLGRFAKPAT